MKKLLVLLAMVAFGFALPFIGNKHIVTKNPSHLDVDGNFIRYDFKKVNRVGGGPDWDYNLKPVQISERVYCFFGEMNMPTKDNAGAMANICYIKGDTEWIAWDSGPSDLFAKQAYTLMKKIKDMPVKDEFVSHEHDDHWLGNHYFKETFGTHIIGPSVINTDYYGPRLHVKDEGHPGATGEVKDYPGMQTRMVKALYQNAIRGTQLMPVDETPKEKSTMYNISGVKMEYVRVGYAHSSEDYFLYLPDDKVILVGDLVMNGRVTSNRDGQVLALNDEGKPEGQIPAIEEIQKRDWNNIVPGHGFLVDKNGADEAFHYFDEMKTDVLAAIDDDVDQSNITKVVTLEDFRDKDLYYLLSAGNVYRAYEELEMYEEPDDEDE
jgi:glyoxylase-like metal-dependent hydrolase (beta-lactamase superfamily II)